MGGQNAHAQKKSDALHERDGQVELRVKRHNRDEKSKRYSAPKHEFVSVASSLPGEHRHIQQRGTQAAQQKVVPLVERVASEIFAHKKIWDEQHL
jgi:hypothetical protein